MIDSRESKDLYSLQTQSQTKCLLPKLRGWGQDGREDSTL